MLWRDVLAHLLEHIQKETVQNFYRRRANLAALLDDEATGSKLAPKTTALREVESQLMSRYRALWQLSHGRMPVSPGLLVAQA